MDTVDRITRSRIMASVGQRNTSPEMILRSMLHRRGLRYRLHNRRLPGTPDLVFPQYHAVIFVHGCFWHAHEGCKFATKPSVRKEFWQEKFEANQKRDKRNYESLIAMHWRVLVVWQCAIKVSMENNSYDLGKAVEEWLKSIDRYREIGQDNIF